MKSLSWFTLLESLQSIWVLNLKNTLKPNVCMMKIIQDQ